MQLRRGRSSGAGPDYAEATPPRALEWAYPVHSTQVHRHFLGNAGAYRRRIPVICLCFMAFGRSDHPHCAQPHPATRPAIADIPPAFVRAFHRHFDSGCHWDVGVCRGDSDSDLILLHHWGLSAAADTEMDIPLPGVSALTSGRATAYVGMGRW